MATALRYQRSIASHAAIFTSVTLALLAFPHPAQGKRPKELVVTAPSHDRNKITREVSYRDLNLASPSGEKVLNKRVRYAVKGICLNIFGMTSFPHQEDECRNELWGSAQPQIGRAVQRAREIARTGNSSIAAASIVISFK